MNAIVSIPEIAAFIKRDRRTVQGWFKKQGHLFGVKPLPIEGSHPLFAGAAITHALSIETNEPPQSTAEAQNNAA